MHGYREGGVVGMCRGFDRLVRRGGGKYYVPVPFSSLQRGLWLAASESRKYNNR